MSGKKAPAAGPRQLKQTKLTFGSAFQSSPQQQNKNQRISSKDDQDDLASNNPEKFDVKSFAASKSGEAAESPGNDTSLPVSPALGNVSNTPETPIPTIATQHSNLRVIEKVGDIFDAPRRSILIHACNAVGSWGGGIALAFRERYPDAYRIYNAHCKRSLPQRLVGTALLIAPRDGTRREHYVGCLFTSKRYGRNKDSPHDILRATEPAMKDLIEQILAEMASGEEVGEVRICHINSGLFAVPWMRSKSLIEGLQVGEEDIPEGVTFSRDIIAYAPE
ncbi:hypothetical protein QBC34DRAFT_394832 [Podospora aff. communis PSN243]|uniref:ADP-ribose 1''-phosphate phosphatase n=1 Tax=Podospora aff. communis PSN243 TaxID=3040156 RepID=A0AAV9H0W9_9PEZI|nr:hypothetical protein QBC34DRAFT_394832 [Podospora aff. communis PSN243]